VLSNSEVQQNEANSEGGGIYTSGQLTVRNSTIWGNQTTGGNGYGGGIDVATEFGSLGTTIENSTIVNNVAVAQTGGESSGGGIYDAAIGLVLDNVTIAGGHAHTGGGIFVNEATGQDAIFNSILAENEDGDCAGSLSPTQESAGTIADDSTCSLSGTGDKSSGTPELQSTAGRPVLATTGGHTATVELGSSSGAIGIGQAAHCPELDQREFLRSASSCDAGAVEHGSNYAYTVQGTASPGAGGTVTVHPEGARSRCSSAALCTVELGSKVKLTASANEGYGFVEWTGEPCHAAAGAASTCSLSKVEVEKTVGTAKFARRFTVSGTTEAKGAKVLAQGSGPDASCTAGSCTVDEGETVTLTAESSAANIQFGSWTGGSCQTENPCKLEHVKATETDIANFELGPPNVPPHGTGRVYFDAEASSEGNGSSGAPYRSVRAIEPLLERREEEIAHEHGEVSPLELLFAGGEYEGLQFTSGKEISVYGDLNPNTWRAERQPAKPTRFHGTPQGLLLDGSKEMSFQQVDFQGVAGPAGSVYGVRMIHGSSATFTDVGMTAGNAPAGARGGNGATGTAGGTGEAGGAGYTPGDVRGFEAEQFARVSSASFEFEQYPTCPGVDQHGNWAGMFAELQTIYRPYSSCGSGPAPPGPQWTREPGDGGSGGWGGWLHGSGGGGRVGGEGSAAIDDGAVAAAGGTGGAAGQAESTWCCENGKSATSAGTAGKHGGQGSQGADQGTQPTSASDLYQQGAGVRGGTGFSGGGGGGGAGGSGDFDSLTNGAGDGGGSGGAGGFGGEGGAGGEEGGGSFGLYLADRSSAKVEAASELSSGRGGPGGEGGSGGGGGAGGSGGKGGAYAASTIGAGSNGGAGGGGGPGGGGGGGAGGPSYAVFGPGESVELASDTIEHVGGPGLGGYPGGWGGEPAPSGGGGPNSPCSANCKVNPNLPVQLPSSVTVSKGVIVILMGCLEACTGKLTLTSNTSGKRHVKALALAAKHSKGASVLGKLSFSLPAKKIVKLHVHLSKAEIKQLKGIVSLKATLTVDLRLGKKKLTKYSDPISLYGPKAPKSSPTKVH